GPRPLFAGVSFTVHDGDRIGLIGPNGAGKSTLLKILAAQMAPDGGVVAPRGGLRVAYLPQSPTFAAGATVRETVAAGVRAHRGAERVRRGRRARTAKEDAGSRRGAGLAGDGPELSGRARVRGAELDCLCSGGKHKRLIEARASAIGYGERAVLSGIDLFIGP